jgi:hypothetical protein
MKKWFLPIFFLILGFETVHARTANGDRYCWTSLLYRMSEPVLSSMSRGELIKNMPVELSPSWNGPSASVAYMEAFARLMMGLAPWLSLPDDQTPEGKQRKHLRELAVKSYTLAVDPDNPDRLSWTENQALVDAAFLANSFLRAPEQLWKPLDSITKKRYVERFQSLRRVDPPYNNWLLFSAMVETFLMSVGEQYDAYRIHSALRKTEEWYVGDGWYSDGEHFAFDYYNSFVIQPMYMEVLEELVRLNQIVKPTDLDRAKKRMKRYSIILERFISPEGTFPAFGRSITYRTGVFQPLALLAWRGELPEELPEGQVRSALTCVMKRMFEVDGNFGKEGFLQLGFAGHQPGTADSYSNNGSAYLASLVFLPLGLPDSHSFWTSVPQDWTAKKAWNGQPFPKDKAVHY